MLLQYSILVCLIGASLTAPGSKPKLRPTRLSKTENNVCTTQVCQDIATSIKQAMDTTADPCTDFFQYACGNYETTVPPHYTSYNRFAELEVANLRKIKAMLDEPHQNQEPAIYKKVKDYYASCINTNVIQQSGLQPTLRLLKKHGGWPVAEPFWDEWSSESWTSVLFKLMESGLGYNYIFRMDLGFDFESMSYRPVTMDFPPLTLSLNALATGPTSYEYSQHFNMLVKIAEALGANQYQAVNDMQNVLRLESALLQAAIRSKSEGKASNITGAQVKIVKDPKNLQSNFFSTDYSRLAKQGQIMYFIELEKLKQALPSVNWNLFFKRAMQTESLQNLHIVSSNPNYITRAIQILDSVSKRTVINYLLLRAVLDTDAGLYNSQTPAREFMCTEEVVKQLPMLTANMYLKKIFKQETKDVADDMVKKLESIFKKRMQRATWMDETTKQNAIDKLLNVEHVVAYPKQIKDIQFLEKLHQEVNIQRNTYFENRLATVRFLHKMDMAPFPTAPKKSDWIRKATSVTLVNANYFPIANTVWMPAGILQGAFFNADRPQSMNFGGIGAVIGHELTHGFDNQGRHFTKDGTQDEWWTAETIRKFDEKAQCLEKQFSSVYVPEIQISLNGTLTLGENIADNGGFRQAYEAYEEWMTTNEPEPVLPGLDFNNRQLFWLSNANVWCEKITRDQLLDNVQHEVHSPNRYRIIIGFQNFEEFSNDFGCPVDSPMNPAKKCQIW